MDLKKNYVSDNPNSHYFVARAVLALDTGCPSGWLLCSIEKTQSLFKELPFVLTPQGLPGLTSVYLLLPCWDHRKAGGRRCPALLGFIAPGLFQS